MAVYDISQEGIDNLNTLAGNLSLAVDDIGRSCEALYSYITLLEDGLGVYYQEILLTVEKVLLLVKKAREGEDGIDALVGLRIPHLTSEMEEYMRLYGAGEEDPPKVLKPR